VKPAVLEPLIAGKLSKVIGIVNVFLTSSVVLISCIKSDFSSRGDLTLSVFLHNHTAQTTIFPMPSIFHAKSTWKNLEGRGIPVGVTCGSLGFLR